MNRLALHRKGARKRRLWNDTQSFNQVAMRRRPDPPPADQKLMGVKKCVTSVAATTKANVRTTQTHCVTNEIDPIS